ncbi:hypothetical protein FQZ97_586830 [compost metagenome]
MQRHHLRRRGLARDGCEVERRLAAPAERGLVGLHGHAVDLDGLVERLRRQRHEPLLEREAQQEQVGRDGVAHEARGQLRGVDEVGAAFHRFLDERTHLRGRKLPVGLLREVPRRLFEGVDQRVGAARPHARDGVGRAGREHVAAQDQVGLAGGNALRLQLRRVARDAHVRRDRAVLLRHARHVEHAHALAFEVRRHADQRADGDHARAADAGDEDVVHAFERERHGSGQGGFLGGLHGHGCVLARLHAFDRHEARAEALDARLVGVARALVDAALQAQVGLLR